MQHMLQNSLPQNTADVYVDAKVIHKLMEQKYIGVSHTMISHLAEKALEPQIADSWESVMRRYHLQSFPILVPLGHLPEVKYWGRQMFDLAKYSHSYIPFVQVVYVSQILDYNKRATSKSVTLVLSCIKCILKSITDTFSTFPVYHSLKFHAF